MPLFGEIGSQNIKIVIFRRLGHGQRLLVLRDDRVETKAFAGRLRIIHGDRSGESDKEQNERKAVRRKQTIRTLR
jgi:hypothetical protein